MTKWDDYEAFCNIVEHGGFTAAARYVKAPKSSLSAALRRLEEELNVRLLERNTRAVRLTEAGRFLYAEMRPVFPRLREARDEAMSFSRTATGLLKIAAPYEFASHHLTPAACLLMHRHPGLRIQIDMRYAPISLYEENYDIVFSMADHELPPSNTVARRILSLRREIFASPALIETWGMPKSPDDLARMPLIAGSGEAEWVFYDEHKSEFTLPIPSPRMRSTNAEMRVQAAAEGLGVTRVTASYCERMVAERRLVRLLSSHICEALKIYAMFPGSELMPYKARLFLDTVDAQLHSRAR